jgi:predicted Zn-dependent protease
MHFKVPAIVATAALATAVVVGCAVNPATGQRELSLVSESQEIAMGREYDPQIVASMGLYPDSAVQRYVREIGLRMAAQSERPNLPWSFRVIDDPVVNAFAVPGGFIYVTRGILGYMDNEAQLAAVLGHEIGHVTARHTAQQITRSQLAQGALVVGSVLSETVAGVAGEASQGLQLLFLKFGRDDERQSDDLAFRYMGRTDYDMREVPDVFEMLSRVSAAQGGGGRVPEWLSTHPDPGNRRADAQAKIAQLPADSIGKTVARDGFINALDNIVYGPDPRQGYFQPGNQFIHPELAFRITFPDGWQTANQPQAVMAGSPQQNALMQLTLSQGSSPDAAATAFISQEGLQPTQPRRETLNGLNAVTTQFTAQTQQGAVSGMAAFVELGGRVYEILGYGLQQGWSSNSGSVQRSLGSFARVTDRALLEVEPMRIDIVRTDRAMTLSEFGQRNSGPATMEELVLLNQATGPDQRYPAGTLLKRVVGRRPPG